MTANEILELVRAGYSKAEIEAMNGNKEQEKEKPTEQEKPKEQEKPTEQEKETKTDNGNNEFAQLTEVVKNLTETVKAMQADNAKKVSGEQPKTDTADSVIRSFFGEVPKN